MKVSGFFNNSWFVGIAGGIIGAVSGNGAQLAAVTNFENSGTVGSTETNKISAIAGGVIGVYAGSKEKEIINADRCMVIVDGRLEEITDSVTRMEKVREYIINI